MKKTLILLVSLLVSLLSVPEAQAYDSWPSKPKTPSGGNNNPDPNSPGDVPPPIIMIPDDPLPGLHDLTFVDPYTQVCFNSYVSTDNGTLDIVFERASRISSVTLKNMNRGETITYYYDALLSGVSLPMPTSNGTWLICLETATGARFYAQIIVNRSSNGPLTPTNWFIE